MGNQKIPEHIEKMLQDMSVAELRSLLRTLRSPTPDKPAIKLVIPLTHHYRCKLCGRMWETVRNVSANTEDLTEPILHQNSCTKCEFQILKYWDKQSIAVFLRAVAEYGISNAHKAFERVEWKPPLHTLKWTETEDEDTSTPDDSWVCKCNEENTGRFCNRCGTSQVSMIVGGANDG